MWTAFAYCCEFAVTGHSSWNGLIWAPSSTPLQQAKLVSDISATSCRSRYKYAYVQMHTLNTYRYMRVHVGYIIRICTSLNN